MSATENLYQNVAVAVREQVALLCTVIIDFPAEVLVKGLRHSLSVAAPVHGDIVLEAVPAEEIQQGLKLGHFADANAAEASVSVARHLRSDA